MYKKRPFGLARGGGPKAFAAPVVDDAAKGTAEASGAGDVVKTYWKVLYTKRVPNKKVRGHGAPPSKTALRHMVPPLRLIPEPTTPLRK